jgi:hypothetical protein
MTVNYPRRRTRRTIVRVAATTFAVAAMATSCSGDETPPPPIVSPIIAGLSTAMADEAFDSLKFAPTLGPDVTLPDGKIRAWRWDTSTATFPDDMVTVAKAFGIDTQPVSPPEGGYVAADETGRVFLSGNGALDWGYVAAADCDPRCVVDDIEAHASTLIEALGVDTDNLHRTVTRTDEDTWVRYFVVRDNLISDMGWTFGYDNQNRFLQAGGLLATPVPADRYPIADTQTLLARIPTTAAFPGGAAITGTVTFTAVEKALLGVMDASGVVWMVPAIRVESDDGRTSLVAAMTNVDLGGVPDINPMTGKPANLTRNSIPLATTP